MEKVKFIVLLSRTIRRHIFPRNCTNETIKWYNWIFSVLFQFWDERWVGFFVVVLFFVCVCVL